MTTLVSADGRWQWNGRRWKAVTNAEGEVQPWTQAEAANITELNTSPGYQASSILTADEEAALESALAETSFFQSAGTSVEGGAIVGDASGPVLGETTALLGAETGAVTVGGTIPVAGGATAVAAGGSTGTTILGAGAAGILALGGAIIGGTLGSGSGKEKNPDRNKGYTLPGHHFVGPGNDADDEDPVDKDDEIAKKHDHAYKNALTHDDIRKADEVAIKEFHDDWKKTGNIHSLIGRVGIQLKHAAEGKTGVKYPSISGKKMPKYRWRFDRDNWPDQRITWDGMSRSQKAYTIRQYNKARKTQQLPVVPNPFTGDSSGFLNPDNTETITPKTPGRYPIQDIGGHAKTRPGHGPIIDSLKSATNIARERQLAIEAEEIRSLNEFFQSAEGKAYLESLAIQNDEAESEQFSGGQAPTRELPPAEGEGVPGPSGVQTRGQKRQQEEQGQAERPPQPEATMAGGDRGSRTRTGNERMDVDSTTPKTVKADSKSGEPKADGGFDSAQGPEGYIPTAGYNHGSGYMVFEKIHQVKSFAIPFLNLVNEGDKITTTPLAEIPWDRPLFYMSEAEFNLIPAGSHFTKCEIDIHNIVSSTQYPTGSSASSTATFNHPKIGMIGFDLMRKCRGGKTQKYTMSSEKEMLVTAVGDPDYDDFIKKQYGTDQSSDSWDTDPLPGTMFPIPYNLYNYFSVFQPTKEAASTAGFNASNSPGYENFSSAISQFNLNDYTWASIFHREYKFTSAPIGTPFKHLEIITSDIDQSVGNHVYTNIRRKVTGITPQTDMTITESIVPSKESGIHLVTYKNHIEQGSNFCIGDAPRKPARQPSIHVGMKAIPKLSSLTNDTRASEFVHSEMFYVIKAKIYVQTNAYPNRFIQPKVFNVPIEGTQTGTGHYAADTSNVVTWNLSTDL